MVATSIQVARHRHHHIGKAEAECLEQPTLAFASGTSSRIRFLAVMPKCTSPAPTAAAIFRPTTSA